MAARLRAPMANGCLRAAASSCTRRSRLRWSRVHSFALGRPFLRTASSDSKMADPLRLGQPFVWLAHRDGKEASRTEQSRFAQDCGTASRTGERPDGRARRIGAAAGAVGRRPSELIFAFAPNPKFAESRIPLQLSKRQQQNAIAMAIRCSVALTLGDCKKTNLRNFAAAALDLVRFDPAIRSICV